MQSSWVHHFNYCQLHLQSSHSSVSPGNLVRMNYLRTDGGFMIINRAVWSIKINGVYDYVRQLARKRVWVCCSNCKDAHVVMSFLTKI